VRSPRTLKPRLPAGELVGLEVDGELWRLTLEPGEAIDSCPLTRC
jgi:hypothetical protein